MVLVYMYIHISHLIEYVLYVICSISEYVLHHMLYIVIMCQTSQSLCHIIPSAVRTLYHRFMFDVSHYLKLVLYPTFGIMH